MIYILTLLTLPVTGLWTYFYLLAYRQLRNKPDTLRGILKHYNLGTLNEELSKIVKNWLFAFAGLFIVIYLWVAYYSWETDYNFLIAIYPFLWHYFFFRYFLWEKDDLLDESPKK